MRVLVAVVVVGCGHPPPSPPVLAHPAMPRLASPTPIDPARPGAAYLSGIALQLQPGWGQFLDDCRLRLPATHALNDMTLAVSEDLVIDRAGKLVAATLAQSSGNTDFDRAAREVIDDAQVYGAPPVELLSDDDRAHVRWLFARDRRQAGPATSEVVRVELPIAGVTERLIADGDLARAARRVALAPAGPEQSAAARRVMVAALVEALHGGDTAARRATVAAIATARVTELAADVRALLDDTGDVELLLAAIAAAVALHDHDSIEPLHRAVERDIGDRGDPHPRPLVTTAELRALIALGGRFQPAAKQSQPNPLMIEVFGIALPEAVDAAWFARGDPRTRSAVCAALAGVAALPGKAPDRAEALLHRGLGDRDATVRARCIESAVVFSLDDKTHAPTKYAARFAGAIRDLERDRDREVRAAAIVAAAVIDRAHVVDASGDSAVEVRTAYARALALVGAPDGVKLRALADDRDPDVRAAAWVALAKADPAPDRATIARAAADPAPQVRIGAIALYDDETALEHLAAGDDAPEVRTAALVRLAHLRGRAHSTPHLLERLAAASPRSADRARIALAWLLAP